MSQKIDLKVEYTNKMAQENEALKAQVEVLRELIIEHIDEWELDSGMWDEAKWHEKCLAALESTPTQCLQKIKAQAFKQGFYACISDSVKLGMISADGEFANQLCQQAKVDEK